MTEAQLLHTHCPFLKGLGHDVIESLLNQSEILEADPGEAIFSIGEIADKVFIVLSGRLAALVPRDWGEDRVLEEFGIGDLVGEVEVLNGDERLSDVRAMETSRCLSVPLGTFEQLLSVHEQVWKDVSSLARTRICRYLLSRQINEMFGTGAMEISSPLLRLQAEQDWLDFELEILHTLEKNVDWLALKRGEYLFRQGDDASDAFVVVSGTLQVRIQDPVAEDRIAAEVGPGEIVGELALFTKQRRTASLVATRDCELFRIPGDLFTRTAEKYPQILLNVYRSSLDRIVHNTSRFAWRPKISNVAILPASPDLGLGGFVAELTAAMARHGAVGSITSALVDTSLGRSGIAQSGQEDPGNFRVAQWLNGQERRHDRVVYQADSEWSGWTDRCVRQADHVLVVANANDRTAVSTMRDRAPSFAQQWSLVLRHPPDTVRPRETARLLDGSAIESVYHVRSGNEKDLARLARILSGRAVSLVLGGGGARGFAHLGVLRALEELGVVVDMVGGSSIGAPIAGWIAQGLNATQCLDSAAQAFKSLMDPTLPLTSLLAGERITRMIYAQTGDWDIEDYWLPFFCVSTNLTTGQTRVHRRGNSAWAIRASVSIPGVLPPVPDGDELFVDGGVLNNLPIDIMRELNPAGILIASDVTPPRALPARSDFGLSVSGWRQALHNLFRWRDPRPIPGVAATLVRSMMVGSELTRRRVLTEGLTDFYQNTDVTDVGMLQFDAVRQAAEAGYRGSITPLTEWQGETPG
jgi:predicted acylesterase/phospholipase RssA/CRP-like cAMP-binding protein